MGFVAELFGDALLGAPHELNWFMIAVDLKMFTSPGRYFEAADHLRSKIEGCSPMEGVEKVMWPGQPELEAMDRQGLDGIDYSADELRGLTDLEARFSIKLAD